MNPFWNLFPEIFLISVGGFPQAQLHSPPFETRLDLIQGGTSAGSRSIKEFIQNNQPLLTLQGHIHESLDNGFTYKSLLSHDIFSRALLAEVMHPR
jgi:hypothetical protein